MVFSYGFMMCTNLSLGNWGKLPVFLLHVTFVCHEPSNFASLEIERSLAEIMQHFLQLDLGRPRGNLEEAALCQNVSLQICRMLSCFSWKESDVAVYAAQNNLHHRKTKGRQSCVMLSVETRA